MRERSPYNWSYPSPWAELKPGQMNLLQRFEEESVFALGVASMHYSGYVRDEALRKLSDTQDGTELPFLLLRLNDWIQQVRQTALALVRLRVTSKYAPFFVMNIALVNRLRLARRGEQEGMVGEVEQLLRSEQGRTALLTGLASSDYQVKRACYKLGFGAEGLHQIQLVERHSPSPTQQFDCKVHRESHLSQTLNQSNSSCREPKRIDLPKSDERY